MAVWACAACADIALLTVVAKLAAAFLPKMID
jgi:hypothetical protein